ncbi:MAG TPA: ATP-binding protein [Burkholderiaceae bacterium]|nr:ATP-binding protein [Burkholderiaceae bacterium]
MPTPTVRRWLVALVVAAVLPTFIAASAALLYAYQRERAAFQQSLRETTRTLALLVDREIARRETIALALAGSPTLTRGDLRAFYDYATRIAPTRDKVVVLHAPDGHQLVNTRLPFGAPLPPSRIGPEREKVGPLATLVSNMYFAPVGGQYSFAVQVPVVREGKVIYYLSVAGFASALQPILDDQRLPPGWVASILDGKGVIVARNVGGEQYVGKPVSARLAARLKESRGGVFKSVSIDGRPILASFMKSPGYEWAVVVGVPLQQAVMPPQVVIVFGLLAVVLLGLSLLVAVRVGRRLLLPVERLKAASQALGSGARLELSSTGLAETDEVLAAMREASIRIARAAQDLEMRRLEAEAAADALRASNERLHLATATSGQGLFTWEPASNRVTWHNALPYQIFGIPQTEPPITAARFFAEFLHPDDADSFAACLKKTLEDGSPFHFLGRIRRRDGEQRWIEMAGRRQPEQPGQAVEIVGTLVDVTERRKAEEALRVSEWRLRQLANTIPNLAWMADADGAVIWYNDRWYDYTGTTLEEMRSSGWHRVHHPSTLEEVKQRWARCLQTGEIFEMPFVPLRGKDGQYRPFFTRAVPLRDDSGAIVQWFGTNTDVSTLKRAEEELREADRRKDQFIAVLAHELRNPLAPIRTAAELLRRMPDPAPSVARAADIIVRQVGQMKQLLDDLLDVSRITRGLMKLDLERVKVNDLVSHAVEQVHTLIDRNGQQLVIWQEDDGAEVMASPVRMTQVLANLLDNAAKYSGSGSTIRVEVRRCDEDRVRIAVVDEGRGISAELLPHVFEPFTQGDRTSDGPQSGLGLGLAIVRGLVQLQGGEVRAYSEGPGRGSRFEIELPAASAPQGAGPAATSAAGGGACRSADPLKVLVVDDNVDGADALAALLSNLGHEVRCAYTGAQGLALMRQSPFDMAICDIGLPEMSGLELAQAVRREQLDVKHLVALSGYGQRQDVAASLGSGFSQHLIKPVEPQELMDLLRRLGHRPSPSPEGLSTP